MKKSERAYLKHFLILAMLAAVLFILASFHVLPAWAMQSLVVIGFLYLALFFIGLMFNVGPFKYIGKLYVEDAKQERRARISKQPWE